MASPCDNRLTVNIKKLPIINDISSGDFLIVETTDGTNILDFRNFLITLDNTTFGSTFLDYSTRIDTISANLALSASDLGLKTNANTSSILILNEQVDSLSAITDTIANGFPNTADIRISLDSTKPVPTEDVTSSETLYVYPYRGDKVSLYDTVLKRWVTHTITKISQPLVDTSNDQDTPLAGNTNFDVYLQSTDGVLEVSFEPWSNSTAGNNGPQNRKYIDGVCVHTSNEGKRLIGCIRTTDPGTSEQTFGGSDIGGVPSKQFVWNAQNRLPVSCVSWETSTYTAVNPTGATNTGWRKVNPTAGNGTNYRFSFILGDISRVDMVGQVYANSSSATAIGAYTSFVVNSETDNTPNVRELTIPEFTGTNVTPTSHLMKVFEPGYHFCQMVEKYYCSGITVNINETTANQTGFIASVEL
jgi:hypothetical protein